MVSTPEGCTDNSMMTPNPSVSTNDPRARKNNPSIYRDIGCHK